MNDTLRSEKPAGLTAYPIGNYRQHNMQQVITALEESRTKLIEVLEHVDWETTLAPNHRNRVHDVACHIAQWERNLSGAIEAHALGGTFAIAPFDIDAINARVLEMHKRRTPSEVLQMLEATRCQFLDALQIEGDMDEVCLPWGKKESLAHIANDMLGHEIHHTKQIEDALG